MNVKLIKTERDYEEAVNRIDTLMSADAGADLDELKLLSLLVSNYEETTWPIDLPDPIEAIRFAMEQQERTQSDLARLLGGKNRASEILGGKRTLTVEMISRLHSDWRIPLESLIQPATLKPTTQKRRHRSSTGTGARKHAHGARASVVAKKGAKTIVGTVRAVAKRKR